MDCTVHYTVQHKIEYTVFTKPRPDQPAQEESLLQVGEVSPALPCQGVENYAAPKGLIIMLRWRLQGGSLGSYEKVIVLIRL